MIHASCRKDFTSTTFLGPLQFRDDDYAPMTLMQALDECAGQPVDIFVHGYKNDFEGARKAYRLMDATLDAKGITGRRIGFYWPGSWARLGFLFAKWRTDDSAERLATLISMLKARGCRVTVETHSLGARVALEALKLGARVDTLLLTAPAVNADCLSEGKEFGQAILNASVGIVLWSKNDSVLKYAYRAASGFRAALGLVGLAKPKPMHVAGVDLSAVVNAHGDYKDVAETYTRAYWRGL